MLARRDRLDEAYTWMQRAYRNARETGHRGNQLRTRLTLARTAAARSDTEAAQSHPVSYTPLTLPQQAIVTLPAVTAIAHVRQR